MFKKILFAAFVLVLIVSHACICFARSETATLRVVCRVVAPLNVAQEEANSFEDKTIKEVRFREADSFEMTVSDAMKDDFEDEKTFTSKDSNGRNIYVTVVNGRENKKVIYTKVD